MNGTVEINDLPAGSNTLVYEVGTAPCSDTALVIIDIVPEPQYVLTLFDVSCFGENDGFVAIDTVDTGTGPYTVAINGIEQSEINNAGPDSYTITVEDGFGCQVSDFVTIVEPEPLDLVVERPRYDH